MPVEIPDVDRGDLAEWAFAQMYRAMKLAEQAFDDYVYNKKIIENSKPGDRLIPRQEDLSTIAGDNQMYVRNAHMYAAIFTAAELADDSPRRKTFQRTIQAVDAHLGRKLIPRQRTP